MTRAEQFEVIVIGGGQAGLAAGYHLAARGVQFVILEAGRRIGDSWRNRWESLRLFTPARLDSLPGLPFPTDTNALPTKDAMADYLCSYASQFNLPIRHELRVDEVKMDAGRFQVSAGEQRFVADNVIVATGGQPKRPSFARELNAEIRHLHSFEYRSVEQLKPGPTLVVGAGNSGAEIAIDSARAGHPTWLSGQKTGTAPPVLYSRPTWWLATRLLTTETAIGRRIAPRALARGAPLVRLRERDLRAADVKRVPRMQGVADGDPVLADGSRLQVDNVVWCTGFDWDLGHLRLLRIDPSDFAQNHRGVFSRVPGLYSVGRPFQVGIDSALIAGVGRDAEYVVDHIARQVSRRS